MDHQKVVIGDATLYCGDCLAIMPGLGMVDCVVTDPPYDELTHLRAASGSNGFGISFDHLPDIPRVLEPMIDISNGWLLIFCSLEMLGKYQAASPSKYIRGMVWDRIVNTPQFSGDRPAQAVEGIALLHSRGKNMKWNGGGKAGIFRHLGQRGDKQHPTQKPVKLINEIVRLYSNQGHTILDPFTGSGTTGVACAQLGRKFIGIELDEKYFQIACKRIENAYAQPSLFNGNGEPEVKPEQMSFVPRETK